MSGRVAALLVLVTALPAAATSWCWSGGVRGSRSFVASRRRPIVGRSACAVVCSRPRLIWMKRPSTKRTPGIPGGQTEAEVLKPCLRGRAELLPLPAKAGHSLGTNVHAGVPAGSNEAARPRCRGQPQQQLSVWSTGAAAQAGQEHRRLEPGRPSSRVAADARLGVRAGQGASEGLRPWVPPPPSRASAVPPNRLFGLSGERV
jgi:hypothetical protein